jgi:hypothetical protein
VHAAGEARAWAAVRPELLGPVGGEASRRRLDRIAESLQHADRGARDVPHCSGELVGPPPGVDWVAPGGCLAVTTRGPDLSEPANSRFWDAVQHVPPDLTRHYNLWDQLTDPRQVTDLLATAGSSDIHVDAVSGQPPTGLPRPVLGDHPGQRFRATHDALSPAERSRVHYLTLTALTQDDVPTLQTNGMSGTATMPGGPVAP